MHYPQKIRNNESWIQNPYQENEDYHLEEKIQS